MNKQLTTILLLFNPTSSLAKMYILPHKISGSVTSDLDMCSNDLVEFAVGKAMMGFTTS